jgi:hypothetical protein
MKKNVLVFPCGSEIGLEVLRSLNYSTHFNLIGGSSVDDHGRFVYSNYIGGIPHVDSDGFLERINKIIQDNSIDFIIPTHDSVVLKLAKAKARGDLKCELISSSLETCEIARSKLKTYQHLRSAVRTPMIFQDTSSISTGDLPVFLKPEVGQGSKGTFLAQTIQEVNIHIANDPSLLLLEYLPVKEYTVECFTDHKGELKFCEGRERRRIMNGISVNTVTVNDERFRDIAGKINDALVFRGAWFFQLKKDSAGELALLEIAPRIAGTMALIRCKGVNLVLLSIFDALGYETEIIENRYHIELDRALSNSYRLDITYSHVYLDFDDLVIFGRKVNPAVMAFVFQCMNKDIKIHLLTRHRQNLEDSLKKYKLSGLFDELIWLGEGEEKYHYIKEKKAVFIDDSFAERKKVFENTGIPVFDSHMLEVLMESF